MILFLASRMIDFLSRRRILWSTMWPCTSIKFLSHNMYGKVSSTPTHSNSVKLFTLILCACDIRIAAPAPTATIIPVWPLQSGWTLYEASIYQEIVIRLSTETFSFTFIVLLMYRMPRFNSPKSSSSGLLTCLSVKTQVSADQAVSSYLNTQDGRCYGEGPVLVLPAAICGHSWGGRKWKVWSAADVGDVLVIASRKSFSIYFAYMIIKILIYQSVE